MCVYTYIIYGNTINSKVHEKRKEKKGHQVFRKTSRFVSVFYCKNIINKKRNIKLIEYIHIYVNIYGDHTLLYVSPNT